MTTPTQATPGPSWADYVQAHGIAYPALMLAVSTLGLLPLFLEPINYDVAALLYVAGRVRDGATLYVDVLEINPPLIVWLSLLPVALARALGVSEILAFRLLVLILISGSLALSGWVLGRALPGRVAVRRGLILLFLFLLLPFVGPQFGQREHLMLALTLPYLVAASARATGVALDGRISIVLGVMAGLGLALKPYFVPLWLVVEAYLAWARRGPRIWLRPENLAVVAVGFVYAGALLGLAPGYLDFARKLKPIYDGYYNRPMAALLTDPVTLLSTIVLLGFVIVRPRGDLRELCRVFLLANGCLLATVLVQRKGWVNHCYPAIASSFVLLGLLVEETRGRTEFLPRRARAVLGGVLAFLLILGSGQLVSRVARGVSEMETSRIARLARLVDEYAKGRSIYVMSDLSSDTFPLVNITGVRCASRFNSLLMLPGIYAGGDGSADAIAFHPLGAMGDMERYLFDGVISDLLRDPPALLIVDASPLKPRFGGRRFDYVEYFSRDPRFEALFQDYELLEDVDIFRVYRLRTIAARSIQRER